MAISSFEVNKETCIRCCQCVSDCVCAIIEMDDAPFIRPDKLGSCIRCGHCQAICPTNSITLDGINPDNLAGTAKPYLADVIESIVKNRRSVRHYHPEPVDEDLLKKAIAIAAWAPTAINIRDMGFIIVNGRDKVEKLLDSCADIMERHNLFPDVAAAIRKGNDGLFRGAPCVLAIYASERPYNISDCATTLAAIELVLPSLGLASCWAGLYTTICNKELPREINLPDGKIICGGLMIGRSKISYKKIPYRPIPPIDWLK